MESPDPRCDPTRRRRRGRIRIAFYGGLALLVGLAVLTGAAERLFYFPSRVATRAPLGVEDVRFSTPDGLTLHGWFYPARGGAGARSPAVLFAHGNAGSVADHAEFADFLPERGFATLVFDYRSYGQSDRAKRSLRRADLVIDTTAALDYLKSRPDIDASRIGVYGYSLGGVIGLAAAAERPEVRSVAAGGAFASWRGIARDKMWLLGAALIPSGLDAEDSAAALGDRPLLLVHATHDEIVPVAHAARIEAAARRAGVRASAHIAPSYGHNDLMALDETARDAVAEFFRSSLAPLP